MKRFLMLIAAAALVLSLTIAVSAAEIQDHVGLLYNGDLVSVFFDAERNENFTEQEEILYNILGMNFSMMNEKFDISAAGYTDLGEMHAFIEETLNVEIFWTQITGDITYTVDDLTGVISAVEVEYCGEYPQTFMTADVEEGTVISTVQQGIAHALKSIDKNNMSDLEMALILHDYIVRECDYYLVDYESEGITKEQFDALHPNEQIKYYPDYAFTAEGVFINRNAVCQGYAIAYSTLLMECGITSCIVTSDPMCHAWNMVKLDEEWYHVDATWDDPSDMRGGFVYHKYFLKSDNEFTALEHNGWVVEDSLDPNGENYSITPVADHENSFAGYAFREVEFNETLSNGVKIVAVRPRMLNKIDDVYYTLMNKIDEIGRWYSPTNVMDVTTLDGNRTHIPLEKSFHYMVAYNEKLYASTENEIVEIGTDGKIVKYVAAERSSDIVNLWLKLDKLQYETEDGVVHDVDVTKNCSFTDGDFTYLAFPDNTANLFAYNGTPVDGEVVIPEKAGDCVVVQIGCDVFKGNKLIKKVTLPETIEKINDYAFYGSNLESINLPVGLKSLGTQAISSCHYLESIVLPVTLKEFGNWVFYYNSSLKTVQFNGDVPKNWGLGVFEPYTGNQTPTLVINKNRTSWQTKTDAGGNTTWTDAYGTIYNVELFDAPLKGDSDGDNAFTKADVDAILAYFIGKSDTVPDASWADIDGDGRVSRRDAMIAARHFEKWLSVAHYFE